MNLPIAFTSEVKIRLLECMMKGHQMLFRNSEIIEGGAERELEPFGLGEIMRVWEDSVVSQAFLVLYTGLIMFFRCHRNWRIDQNL